MKRGIVVLCFIIAILSTGCGSSATDNKKDEPVAERVADADNTDNADGDLESPEEVDVSEPEDTDQEDAESTDSDNVADSVDETDNDEADAVDEEMNEYGLTETQMQKLYDCVEEAVLTGYIEPNGIAPSEFQWPEPDETTYSAPWTYLDVMYSNYSNTGEKYDSDGFEFDKLDDSMCQLMNSVFDGMVAWSEIYQEKIYMARLSGLPRSELFPENIDFTN